MPTKSILLLTDGKAEGQSLHDLLVRRGFQVVDPVQNKVDANKVAQPFSGAQRPELVLIGQDSLYNKSEIEKLLRSMDATDVPKLFLTPNSSGIPGVTERGKNAYFDCRTPIDEQELELSINTEIFRSQSSRQDAQTQKLLASIVEPGSDAVIAVDKQLRVFYVNHACQNLLATGSESINGHQIQSVVRLIATDSKSDVVFSPEYLSGLAENLKPQPCLMDRVDKSRVALTLSVRQIVGLEPVHFLLTLSANQSEPKVSQSDSSRSSEVQSIDSSESERLEFHFQLEQLLSAIAKGFVQAELHTLDREIINALENACRFLGQRAALIYQFDPASESLRNQYRWALEGTALIAYDLEDRDVLNDLHLLLQERLLGWLGQERIERCEGLQKWLRGLGLRGVRIYPLQAHEGVFGLLMFCQDTAEETFDAHTLAQIESIAELIANAEERRQIHVSLRKSESYLNLAQNVAEIGSWEYSPGRDQTTSSVQLNKLFGLTVASKPQSFRGWRKVIHEDDRNRVVAGIINALRDGAAYSTTYRIIRSDGNVRWHHIKARVVRDTFGENRLIAVNYDITDRKAYQDKLEASERRYRQLVEATPDAIIVHRNNEIIYANPASARMLCAPDAQDLIGRTVMEFVHPDFRDFVAQRVKRVQNESQPAPLAAQRLLRLDGKSIDVEIIGIPVNYDDEIATQAIIRDMTERNITQMRLRESEEKLRLMVEHANDAIFTLRQDFEISYISPAIQTQIGQEPEFFLGRPLQRWIHGEDVAGFESALEVLESAPHKKVEVEYRIRNVMREWRWHSTTLSVILNEEGDIQGFVGVAKDVTRRKEVEEALIGSEREMRAMFEQAHDAILLFDAKGFRILDVNERACILYRHSRESLLQVSPRNLSSDSTGIVKHLEQVVSQHGMVASQASHVRADGNKLLLELNSSLVNYKGAQAVLCSIRDVTAQVKAQEEIRKLSLVASKTSNGVVITDSDGIVEWVNQGFTRITGYALEDVSGRKIGDLKSGPATDPQTLIEIDAGIKYGHKVDAEILNYNQQGSTYWAQLQITPIEQNEQSGSHNFVTVMTDITDLKHHEAELKAAKRELEASNQVLEIRVTERTKDLEMTMRKLSEALEKEKLLHDLKSRFVSMVSHEFRTPLSGILSSAELLDLYLERLEVDERKSKFEQIYHAVGRMTEILDQVISLSQSEALTQSFEPRNILMPAFVNSTIKQFRGEFSPSQEFEFEVVRPEDRPVSHSEKAMVDVNLLEPALIGVLKNAAQYSAAETTVLIRLYLNVEDVVIRVTDSGVGIPKDEVNLIFEPFHRAANVEIVPGTGLGLVFVKQCVERHGGAVSVESLLGHGTTVTLKLPRRMDE